MEREHGKELIEGIAGLFEHYEEPYEEGEWEKFYEGLSRQIKRRSSVWHLSGIAALFLMLFVLPLRLSDRDISGGFKIATIKVKERKPSMETLTFREVRNVKPAALASRNYPPQFEGFTGEISSFANIEPGQSTQEERNQTEQGPGTAPSVAKGKSKSKGDSSEIAEKSVNTFSRGREDVDMPKIDRQKWVLGIEVSPNMTNRAMSVEAGFLVQYKLSGRLYLGSGIRVINLQAGEDLTPPHTEGKYLESIDTRLSAVSVPLNATIALNKSFFATFGLTPVTFFQERGTSTFLNNTKHISIGSSGELVETIESKVSTEKSTDDELEDNSYLGFFDLSAGYQLKFLKNANVTVSPFVRIPLGQLATKDMRLQHGGVSFRFTFR